MVLEGTSRLLQVRAVCGVGGGGGGGACTREEILNLEFMKCHFLDFGGRSYRIPIVSLRAPIWAIGIGSPWVHP